MKPNMNTVYIKGQTQFVPYSMSPNFGDGMKTCPECKNPMEKVPNHHSFIRVEGGKVLVTVAPKDGRMIAYKAEVVHSWLCTGCMRGESSDAKKIKLW